MSVRNPIWKKLAAVSAAICLLVLLTHPVAAAALVAAFVLLPVVLLGLVDVPRSLWPALDLRTDPVTPVLARAGLFQRPPPLLLL